MPAPNSDILQTFLDEHALPKSFIDYADNWFNPLVEKVVAAKDAQSTPLCVGISGCQGSGKSTLAEYCRLVLQEQHKLSVATLSLDDIYLTLRERQSLAEQIHPLFITRGVPGTHDIPLGSKLLQQLKKGIYPINLPVFEKLRDDRSTETIVINESVDIIIFEGWCLGAKAQALKELENPCNALELEEDPQGIWRKQINQHLSVDYQQLFASIDFWVMLKAPSFDCVKNWRLEQEVKLAKKHLEKHGTAATAMTEDEVIRFIEHYRRVTEQLLKDLPDQVDYLLELDERRQIFRQSMRP